MPVINGCFRVFWQIALNYPDEYLVQVKGSSHKINGFEIIESLQFISNKQSYGPFGASKPQGQWRSTHKNGKVVGFFGRAGYFVDQLGVITSFPSKREDLLLCQGSWGGPGGSPFCDGRGEIVELLVKYNKTQIITLQVTYEQGGIQYKSQLHGGLDQPSMIQRLFSDVDTKKVHPHAQLRSHSNFRCARTRDSRPCHLRGH